MTDTFLTLVDPGNGNIAVWVEPFEVVESKMMERMRIGDATAQKMVITEVKVIRARQLRKRVISEEVPT